MERLIVVSNRLPFTLKLTEEGYVEQPSAGGLATAMEPILNERGGTWVGWPGEVEGIGCDEVDRLLNSGGRKHRYRPVDTSGFSYTDFYEGYPNQTIWPLFHYFPSQMQFHPGAWEAYVEGNRRFCQAVEAEYQPGDLIWIHDYHLMLLPAMLRSTLPEARIGFFLHIPFPSSELFSNLPRREEILAGLMGADLIAFHTHRHVHHFRSALLRVLGLESTIQGLDYTGRTIALDAMPIGIAPEQFIRTIQEEETVRQLAALKQRFENQCIIAAVDRVDYTKGMLQRLRTFRWLLQTQPSLAGTVVLIQIGVPSREAIGTYQTLNEDVNQLVSEINGKSGTAAWTPVIYINRGISPPELVALYQAADVAWVTPLRDGMNLVAKEYCACKPDGDGLLLLSEFAGAAAELGEALLVNPYDEERVGEALLRALAMPLEERRHRMRALHRRVVRHNVFAWAERFLSALRATLHTASTLEQSGPKYPGSSQIAEWVRSFSDAEEPLLILDYDGTLVPLASRPEQAVPDASLLKMLTDLAADQSAHIAVVSGRRAQDLERFLGAIPGLTLAAEHGLKVRPGPSDAWTYLRAIPESDKWKDQVRPILEHYVDRTPGSFIEEKELALVWHYRNAEPEFADWLAGELLALLEGLLADSEVRPVRGHKVVEILPAWVNKGEFANWIAGRYPDSDFRLAAGDDRTDEDTFARMPEGSTTIRVGRGASKAAYRMRDSGALRRLLNEMTEARFTSLKRSNVHRL